MRCDATTPVSDHANPSLNLLPDPTGLDSRMRSAPSSGTLFIHSRCSFTTSFDFTARVVKVFEGKYVVLDRTVFPPEAAARSLTRGS